MFTLKSMSFLLFGTHAGVHAANKLPSAAHRQAADVLSPRDYAPETPQTMDDKDHEAYFIAISRGM